MHYLKNLYLTWFVLFYRFGGNNWTPSINIWKGVGGVALIDGLLLISFDASVRYFSGAYLFSGLSKWEFQGLFAGLFAINYYVLVARGAGTSFESEFSHIEKSKKWMLSVVGLASIGVIVGFLIYASRFNR